MTTDISIQYVDSSEHPWQNICSSSVCSLCYRIALLLYSTNIGFMWVPISLWPTIYLYGSFCPGWSFSWDHKTYYLIQWGCPIDSVIYHSIWQMMQLSNKIMLYSLYETFELFGKLFCVLINLYHGSCPPWRKKHWRHLTCLKFMNLK